MTPLAALQGNRVQTPTANRDVSRNVQALAVSSRENKRPRLQVFHGASRTRTGDLLGAIQPSSHTESDPFAAFYGRALECRNISRNSLHRVLQRHEILDRSAGAIEEERGEHLHG
jgi:hypothetical protein